MTINVLHTARHREYLAARYMPELDGIRAISILGVITAHMHSHVWTWLSGGRGVLLFFTLSGYLITRLCLQEEARSGAVHFKAFYARRTLRLLPAYILVLAVYCLLILGLGVAPLKRDLLVSALPYYLTYMSDIPGVLGINGVRHDLAFAHSWSLGIEEKFYLVFPVLIFGLLGLQRQLRIPVTIGLTVLFMATPFAGLGAVSALLHPYCSILLGCLVALFLNDSAIFVRLSPLENRRWLLGLLALFLTIHFSVREHTESNVWSPYFAGMRSLYTAVFALLLAAIILDKGWIKKALGWRPLVFLGRMSYGIYLLHILCLNAVERLIGADVDSSLVVSIWSYLLTCITSTVCAALMYTYLESRCIKIGQNWSKRLQQNVRLPAGALV